MSLISPIHILFFAAVALIFVGPKRLPELARALGDGLRGFRDMLNGELPGHDRGAAGRNGVEPGDSGTLPPARGPFA
ncbi:MAG: twin-arginine translocase TatA/TatE family subunit [Solirubrobacteraceae bacterium]